MTAQVPDRIKFRPDGDTHPLCENPLGAFLHCGGIGQSRGHMVATNNWRGYVATWLLHQDRLWLAGLSSRGGRIIARRRQAVDPETGATSKESTDSLEVRAAMIDREERPFSIDGLFPDADRGADEPVFAEWYSGELRIPEGEQLQYVHGGYGSTYERDRLILIERGRVVRAWVRTNEQPEPPNSFWNQRLDEDESGEPGPRDDGDPPKPEA